MTNQPRTRQELYDRIRQQGKEEFILEEMIRLGFWPAQGQLPQDPADEIRRMGEIRKELQELRQQNRQLYDETKLRQQLFKQRLAESRRKQQETKERRERERIDRAQAWQDKQEREIIYLGEEVSGGLNYSECNEEVELDGKTYYVALGERHLPQGSPASPAITNLLCRRLDRRLNDLAQQLGFTYTRYADDLTFSTVSDNPRICNLLKRTDAIVTHEGFAINTDKTRILRKSRQQEVTGIVVNERLSIDRKTLKRFRALLFQIERDGIEGKRWGNSSDTMAVIQGYANFVAMVDSEKGAFFREQIQRIKEGF
jgi:Reverse transcriptase (RNA-dependent DNA polymerase)